MTGRASLSRNPVALAWLAGLAVAALAYLAGPDHFIGVVLSAPERVARAIETLLRNLSASAFDGIRALAIGLFVAFAGLAIAAIRRGQKGRAALVAVSVVFLLLITDRSTSAASRWLGALVLAGCAAAVMSQRLHRSGR